MGKKSHVAWFNKYNLKIQTVSSLDEGGRARPGQLVLILLKYFTVARSGPFVSYKFFTDMSPIICQIVSHLNYGLTKSGQVQPLHVTNGQPGRYSWQTSKTLNDFLTQEFRP